MSIFYFIKMCCAIMNLVIPKAGARHEHLFNKPSSEATLLNKGSCLSFSIRCDLFLSNQWYSLTQFLCYLDVYKPPPEVGVMT
jgi:hypothetical protein